MRMCNTVLGSVHYSIVIGTVYQEESESNSVCFCLHMFKLIELFTTDVKKDAEKFINFCI